MGTTGSFAAKSDLSDTAGGTLKAAGATWTLTGLNTGSMSLLSGTFAGMANLSDANGGTLKSVDAVWSLSGTDTGSVSTLSGTFAGMRTLDVTDVKKSDT